MGLSVCLLLTIIFFKSKQTCISRYNDVQKESAIKYLKNKQLAKTKKALGEGCSFPSDKPEQSLIIWTSEDGSEQIIVLLSKDKFTSHTIKKNE
jgi:hypothetical protein